MIGVEVAAEDGRTFAIVVEGDDITIGRSSGNHVALRRRLVSRRHSRVVLRDGKLIIVDLKSTNGTFVNGKRISSPQVLKGSDRIALGGFTLTFGATHGTSPPGAAPPWAGGDDQDEPTARREAPLPAGAPPRRAEQTTSPVPVGVHDEVTPPLRVPMELLAATNPRPSSSRTVIDDDVALGATSRTATAAPEQRGGDVALLERLRDDGMLITWRGRAAGQDARVVQLCEPLRDDEVMVAVFEDLAQLARRLASPRLPRFLAQERGLLATSPPPAATLHQVLANTGPLPAEVALYVAIEAAHALADFHDVRDHDGAPVTRSDLMQLVRAPRPGAQPRA